MTAPVVFVEPNAMALSPRTSLITGSLRVGLDGTWFPTPTWDDFVVVVLGWWCEALGEASSRTTLSFMDGPHQLLITPTSHACVDIVTISNEVQTGRTTTPFAPFRQAVLAAAEVTLLECTARSWRTDDVATLSAAIRRLRGA